MERQETIKEAEAYAKNVLGVNAKYGDKRDVLLANVVNQIMTVMHKNQEKLPDNIKVASIRKQYTIAIFTKGDNLITINRKNLYWLRVKSFQLEEYNQRFMSSPHVAHIFRHEVAHQEHWKVLVANKELHREYWKAVTPKQKTAIRKEVGMYASRSRRELVAEVYAGLLWGQVYSQYIMKLYTDWGGIIPKSSFQWPGVTLLRSVETVNAA